MSSAAAGLVLFLLTDTFPGQLVLLVGRRDLDVMIELGSTISMVVRRVPQTSLDPGVTPNGTGLPGLAVVREIAGAFLIFGLVGCVIGLAVSVIVWAVGNHFGNYAQTSGGKIGVITSAAGALLIGGAPAIVRFFAALGSKIV